MKIISGSSNYSLTSAIAKQLNSEPIKVELDHFGNGEKRVWIQEKVRGENIALVQSFSHPADEHLVEFLLLTDALERMGARHINAIIPWMGYSLQDKVFRDGEPIAAKVVADLVSKTYIKRAFLLDLHNTSTPGFFSIPTQHLSALDTFADYARNKFPMDQVVAASPDFGGLKRARTFANNLKVDLVNIDKIRDLRTGEVTAVSVHGNVKDKITLIFDDCIQSGGTVVEAAELLKKEGAKEVHFFSSHGPLVDAAFAKIDKSLVDSVIVTNSIELKQSSEKIKVVDVSPLFAQALEDWIK